MTPDQQNKDELPLLRKSTSPHKKKEKKSETESENKVQRSLFLRPSLIN